MICDKNWQKFLGLHFYSTDYVKTLGKLFQRDGKFMHNRAWWKSDGNRASSDIPFSSASSFRNQPRKREMVNFEL